MNVNINGTDYAIDGGYKGAAEVKGIKYSWGINDKPAEYFRQLDAERKAADNGKGND